MTPEQKQRIERIETRWAGSSALPNMFRDDMDFLLSLVKEQEAGPHWISEWPEVNGFYWLRGWRHYADLPIKIDGNEFWMMFNLAANHRADLGDSEKVQFLGPVTPDTASDAAISMRSACVGKVREKIADLSRTSIAAEQNAVELRTLHALHNELEALSIEKSSP